MTVVRQPSRRHRDGWDEWVRRRPTSSFVHLRGWKRVVENVLGHDWNPLVVQGEDGSIRGILPLVEVKSRIFGHYLVSMPFLNYGGALGDDDARLQLAEEAHRVAVDLGVDLLELRSRHPGPEGPLSTRQRKITVLLDLPDDPEVLWKDVLRSKVRSQVRRPRKEGMVARFGPEEVEPFYRVFARNMRDLGTPVLPFDFFAAIQEEFSDIVEFCAIYLDELPVAAGCGFRWNDEFELTWAGSNYDYSRMAPNMLLYWSLMERMIEKDVEVFNFGRCTEGSGTHRFKSQWGDSRDVPLPWLQWSPDGVTEPPNPDAPVYRTATKLWSKLPLPVANRIGPLLSRSLP